MKSVALSDAKQDIFLFGDTEESWENFPSHIKNLIDCAHNLADRARFAFDDDGWVEEVKGNLFGWVNAGLGLFRVKCYRAYERLGFKSFHQFCQTEMGRSVWQVNGLIKASRVVIELIRQGFTQLPSCVSQALKLFKYQGEELGQKWQQVISSMPAHRITANAISETLEGEKPQKYESLKLSPKLVEKLRRRALDLGISVEELLEEMLGESTQEEEVKNEDENLITCPHCEGQAIVYLDEFNDELETYQVREIPCSECVGFGVIALPDLPY